MIIILDPDGRDLGISLGKQNTIDFMDSLRASGAGSWELGSGGGKDGIKR